MGLEIDVRVVGAGEFAQLLSDLSTVHIPEELESMMGEILTETVAEAQVYPPETEGNRPPPPYYSRGAGMIGRGGNVIPGKESQDLKGQWGAEIVRDPDGISGRITNETTYASLVQDEEGPQTTFHAAHGWRTVQSIVRSIASGRGGGATAGAGDPESGIIARVEGWLDRLIQRIR